LRMRGDLLPRIVNGGIDLLEFDEPLKVRRHS
jgi:hypothetical protein